MSLDRVPLESGYTVFPIWAEESGALSNNNTQWSFGNGATGTIGISMTACEVFAVSMEADVVGTSVSIELMKNNAPAVSTLFTGANGYEQLATPIDFANGDLLGFRTDVETGAYSDVRVIAWCRVPLQGLKGDKGESGTNGIPNQIARLTLPAQNVNNAAATNLNFNTATFDTIGITVNANSIDLPEGTYMIYGSAGLTSTVQRSNQLITYVLGGVNISQEAQNAYIRSQGGHNEASLKFSEAFQVASGGQTLEIQSQQIAVAGTVTIVPAQTKLIIIKIS